MQSRYMLGEMGGLAGLTIQFYRKSDDVLVAATNPTGEILEVVDNQDGTYYVDDLPAGIYYVTVNGSTQDEMQALVVMDHLAVNHPNVTNGAHGAHGAVLGSGDVVDALDSNETAKPLSAAKGKALNDGKASVSALNDHTGSANPHTGSASATPGSGLKTETGQKLAVDYDSDDFGLESNKLSLRKAALDSTYRFSPNMSFQQMILVIDNVLRQLEGVAGGGGGYTQTLWNNTQKDDTPSGVLSGAGAQVSGETTYRHRVRVPFWKTPEIRQLVYYFEASIGSAGNVGFVKLECGGLSVESEPIENTYDGNNPNYKALYLDVSGLANFQFHNLIASMKVSGAAELLFTWNEQIVARTAITSLAGETSYTNQNPVE